MIGPAGLAFRRRCWRELRQAGALWQTCDHLHKNLEEGGNEVEEKEDTSPVAEPPPKKLPNLVDSDLKSSQLLFVSFNDFLLCNKNEDLIRLFP